VRFHRSNQTGFEGVLLHTEQNSVAEITDSRLQRTSKSFAVVFRRKLSLTKTNLKVNDDVPVFTYSSSKYTVFNGRTSCT